MTHPYVIDALNRQRLHDLRHQAQRQRTKRLARRTQRPDTPTSRRLL